MTPPNAVPPSRFHTAYAQDTPAPWDIDRPQRAIERLLDQRYFAGRVLDLGCGTGEHVLAMCARGVEAFGVDFVPEAIERARAKATERGVRAEFKVGDALALHDVGEPFDGALDTGLFHTFSDEARIPYVETLARMVRRGGRLALLCFSDREPGLEGPRRVTRAELRHALSGPFTLDELEPARFESHIHEGGAKAWLVLARRA